MQTPTLRHNVRIYVLEGRLVPLPPFKSHVHVCIYSRTAAAPSPFPRRQEHASRHRCTAGSVTDLLGTAEQCIKSRPVTPYFVKSLPATSHFIKPTARAAVTYHRGRGALSLLPCGGHVWQVAGRHPLRVVSAGRPEDRAAGALAVVMSAKCQSR